MVTLCRALFTGADVTFQGTGFRTEHARLIAPPATTVPIYIAASGPKTLALAGRVADGIIMQVGADPRCIAAALDDVRAGLRKAGRDPDSLDVSTILYGELDEDRERARNAARPFAAWIPQTVPRYCDLVGVPQFDVDAVRARYQVGELMKAKDAAAAATDAMVDAFTLSGTGPECHDRVEQIVEKTGVRHVTFFPMGEDRLASLKRFAESVADPLR
jgi:5,10-methylenetetrahydromethanopterin reductase